MSKILDEIIQRLEQMDKRLDVIEALAERIVSHMQINDMESMEEEFAKFLDFMLHWDNEYRKDD